MKKFRNIFLAIAFVSLVVPLVDAKAATIDGLVAQIAALQAQIQQLQSQLTQARGEQGTAWCYDFKVNLRYGDDATNPDVAALQKALNKEGLYKIIPQEDGYFGEFTASAVTGFQQKYKDEILSPLGLKYGTGFAGNATRAKLNKLYGCKQACAQVITYAKNPSVPPTQCKAFPTPCDVPTGWIKVDSCPISTTPSITVLSPNGGEVVQKGASQTIIWSQEGCAYVMADLMEGSNVIKQISVGNSALPGQFTWRIPSDIPDGKNYKIRLICSKEFNIPTDIYDFSDAAFSIVAAGTPSIIVLSPNGGEAIKQGQKLNITWQSNGLLSADKINIWINNYTNPSNIIGGMVVTNLTGDLTSYNWAVPSNMTLSSNFKISVEAYRNSGGKVMDDESDNYFSIVAPTTQPSITVLSPNGGEKWQLANSIDNSVYTVTFNASGFLQNDKATAYLQFSDGGMCKLSADFMIYYLKNTSFNLYNGMQCPNIPRTVTYGDSYKIGIFVGDLPGTDLGKAHDFSDNIFSLVPLSANQPSVTVTSLNDAGLGFPQGQVVNITWTSKNLKPGGTFNIGLADDKNRSGTIVNNLPVTQNSYAWTVAVPMMGYGVSDDKYKTFGAIINPGVDLGNFKVSVYYDANTGNSVDNAGDTNDNYFKIYDAIQPSITVLSPNGGETINLNNRFIVSFRPIPGASHYVNLSNESTNNAYDLLSAMGLSPIIGIAAGGTQRVVIDDKKLTHYNIPSGSKYKIEVCSTNGCDKSDNYFSIVAACVLTDVYSKQVPGYVYSNIYIKANNLPSGDNYKITGSDSWNGTGFTVSTRNADGSAILKGDQTFNSTAVSYILTRKSTIALTDSSNNTVCSPINTQGTSGMGLNNIQSQLASIGNAISVLIEKIKLLIK